MTYLLRPVVLCLRYWPQLAMLAVSMCSRR